MQSVFYLAGHVCFEPVTRRAKSVSMKKREPTSAHAHSFPIVLQVYQFQNASNVEFLSETIACKRPCYILWLLFSLFFLFFFFAAQAVEIVLCNIPCDVAGEPLFQVKLHEVESSFSLRNDCCIARRVQEERVARTLEGPSFLSGFFSLARSQPTDRESRGGGGYSL